MKVKEVIKMLMPYKDSEFSVEFIKKRWTLMARKRPKIGQEVLLFRGVPDGFSYILIGKLRNGRKEFDIAHGMQYDSRVPACMILAWSEVPKFDIMDEYRQFLEAAAKELRKD